MTWNEIVLFAIDVAMVVFCEYWCRQARIARRKLRDTQLALIEEKSAADMLRRWWRAHNENR